MKKAGIDFILFAIFNLVVALIGMKNGIPSETVSMRFHKFIMLIVFGGMLFIGNKMHKKDDV